MHRILSYYFAGSAILQYTPHLLAFFVCNIYSGFIYFVYYRESDRGLINTTIVFMGTWCIIVFYWSLYMACTQDPGFVPLNYTRDPETDQIFYTASQIQQRDAEEAADKQRNESRRCFLCNIIKPERAHHCSKCKRCVYNMDHHCVWTQNCVGMFNRKYFILVLFWGSFALLMGVLIGYSHILGDDWENEEYLQLCRHILTSIICGSSLPNFIGLTLFCKHHLQMVFKNYTQIDDLKSTECAQYDLGWLNNFQFFFGSNPLLWFFPVGEPQGDGKNWPKNTKYYALVNKAKAEGDIEIQ